jgi:hypothetical protein
MSISLDAWMKAASILPAINSRTRTMMRWLVFGIGLLLFVCVQSAVIYDPIWNRAMLPEVDDSYTYLVKTAEMEQCFFQDCPALQDLRKQLEISSGDRQTEMEKYLVEGRIFLVYHPLFSLLLLGLKQFTGTLGTAYQILWTLGPLWFGLGFGCLLAAIWGPIPAGIGLILLSTKVFPGNGIHYVVPSNMAMGIALFVWARIISRNGNAPLALIAGTILMVAMHPLGRIFSAIAIVLSLWMAWPIKQLRMFVAPITATCTIALGFLFPLFVNTPVVSIPSEPFVHGRGFFGEIGISVLTVLVEIVRFEPAIFGSLVFFAASVVCGILVVDPERRDRLFIFLILYTLMLGASLVYVLPLHPADVFLRLWIPLLAVLVGAVATAIWFSARQAMTAISAAYTKNISLTVENAWPLILFAAFTVYGTQMLFSGMEAFGATREYMKARQPLLLDPEQPKLLLSKASSEDLVLYDNVTVIMPFYFVHGAMKLGAIYYPLIKGTPEEHAWVNRPELRFAVAYNPIVSLKEYQPARDEEWWISSPEFRFSPLSKPRITYQIGKEGRIDANLFRSLEIKPGTQSVESTLCVFVHNSGNATRFQVMLVDAEGRQISGTSRSIDIPAQSKKWINTDLLPTPGTSVRIDFPPKTDFSIAGLNFGASGTMWPWASTSSIRLISKGSGSSMGIRFDPREIVPASLAERDLVVVDDRGCSVLLEIRASAKRDRLTSVPD